jgi:peptidoglycan/LPS O-acetylase OafA/YrhL
MLSLRRITSSGAYLPEVDGLRFVAIASVVWYHIALHAQTISGSYSTHNFVSAFLMNMLMHGFQGVGVFFVISGFILGLPFARWYLCNAKPVNLRSYLLRRVTRLEPPYIANLAMRLPLTPAAKHMTFGQVMPHFLASLVYLHVIIFGSQPIVHWGSWSLEIEVQFYLLAPLFALAIFRFRPVLRRVSLALLLVGSGFVQNHLTAGNLRFELSILNYGQFFLAGFLVADLYATELPRWRESWLWDVVSIPLWILIFSVSIPAAHILIPPAAVILFIAAFKSKLTRAFLRLPVICTIGGMCYSIYLTHPLIMDICYVPLSRIRALRPFWADFWVGELVVSIAVLLGGAAFFVGNERPSMDKNWPQHLAAWVRKRNPFIRRDSSPIPSDPPDDGLSISPPVSGAGGATR